MNEEITTYLLQHYAVSAKEIPGILQAGQKELEEGKKHCSGYWYTAQKVAKKSALRHKYPCAYCELLDQGELTLENAQD